MPLQRFELKNEYGLGDTRLYRGASHEQDGDPSIILEGVTVSGIVGILRQLGDLAEFASVVFDDVHQQVIVTAARGDKVLNRIQRIEAALPQLEKAVREQNSCICFAYIAGSDWHANIETSKSQLIGGNLPEFIMDSYEECHDPPRLHLLDKFDSVGGGACLKRYSDPSYLRRMVANSELIKIEKAQNGMKVHRKKKPRPQRTGLARHSMFTSLQGRKEMKSLNYGVQSASLVKDEQSFSVDGTSISEPLSKSDLINEPACSYSKEKRVDCSEVQDEPSMSKTPYDSIPSKETEPKERLDCVFVNLDKVDAIDHQKQDSFHQQSAAISPRITGNEKVEMLKHGKQMQTNDVSERSLEDPSSAELLCEPSYQNRARANLVLEWDVFGSVKCDESKSDCLEEWFKKAEPGSSSTASKENGGDNTETRGKSLSITKDEKAKIVEHSCSRLADVILNESPDSDLFFFTLETSNKCCETDEADLLIQDKILTNFTEMAVPSSVGSQYCDLRSGLDKHMDAADASMSKGHVHSKCKDGQGVILLPYWSCDSVELDGKTQGFTTTSFDGVDGAIDLGTKNYSHVVESARSPEIHRRSAQALVDDVILMEEFLCRDSFDDTPGKVVSEKVIYVEHPPMPELKAAFESTYREMNLESRIKKEIADSNLLWLESDALVTSCSSLGAYTPLKLCDPIVSSIVNRVNYSSLTSHMDSSRNDTEVPENVSGISTSASEDIPSIVPASITVELQVAPVDTIRKPSINIWTNGGLLGLEPSKPSDISVHHGKDDTSDNRSAANSHKEALCNRVVPPRTSVEEDGSNHVECFAEQAECNSGMLQEKSNSFSKKHNKGQNACSGSKALGVNVPKQKDSCSISAGTGVPPINELISMGFARDRMGISAGISSLAHRFLELNGTSSHHKHVARSKQAISSTPLYVLENKDQIKQGFLENQASSRTTSSGLCSPPLEHIKLSCPPGNDSNYSKLKLELCSTNLQGSLGDLLFPSFRLFSESFQPVFEDSLESEDDSFCRPCLYSSDDLLSLYSVSDADAWEDDEENASFRMEGTNSIESCLIKSDAA